MRKFLILSFVLTLSVGLWAQAQQSLDEAREDCTAVEITKGDKTLTLYAPDKVTYRKIVQLAK